MFFGNSVPNKSPLLPRQVLILFGARKHVFMKTALPRIAILILVACACANTMAQDYRWQQRVEYTMNVALDVTSHRMTGTQHLVYYNNSPDTLTKVYNHLYFNAFQPGSMMDVRSRA